MKNLDYQKGLNPQQQAIVAHGDGPCLVLAGAGSGKTKTIVCRVARLIADGVPPERILLLTFTNKAAREMMERIDALIGSHAANAVVGGTFHSVANRILRSHADRLGYTKSFTILDQDDAKSLVKACMKELGIDAKAKRFPSPAILQSLFSLARNALTTIEATVAARQPSFAAFTPDITRIFDAYGRRKRQANAMDFDDLLVRWYELMTKEPGVRQELQEKFRYILVDEYQDTNALQAALVRLLAGETMNVCAVGDDCQSIYSFRAADIRNILEFPKLFPGTAKFLLEVNYRSTPEIVAVANEAIANNPEQFPKELRSAGAAGAKPIVAPAASASREATFVADAVEAALADGTPASAIAVLFRATHHSQGLEFELLRRGIAYDYRGGMKFFERAHVKDALAFLRIADNFADEAAWLRILAIQVGIGDVASARIIAALRGAGSMDAALHFDAGAFGARASNGWKDLRDTLEALHRAPKTPSDLLRTLLKTPYVEYLQNEYADALERLGDIEQLATFGETATDIAAFLAEATLDDAAAGPSQNRRDTNRFTPRIVLSTIHQAKGLEWDTVFVIHLTNTAFPNRRALLEERGLEEERRLFYVAATRAKRQLVFTYPLTTSRDMFGMEQPSLFLEEISPALLEWKGRERWETDDAAAKFFEEDEVVMIGEDGDARPPGSPRKSFLREV